MENIAISIFIFFSGLLGMQNIPDKDVGDWVVTTGWNTSGRIHHFKAENSKIAESCSKFPGYYIEFPTVIHGAHRITLNGTTIKTYGDPTFKDAHAFYGNPILKCSELKGAKNLKWEVYSYTEYFARFYHFPKLVQSKPLDALFNETLNIMTSGSLIFISILITLTFWTKVSQEMVTTIALSAIFFAFYFAFCVPGHFNIHITMLTAHKISDASLWIGGVFFLNAFFYQGIITKKILNTYIVSVVIASIIQLTANSGDVIQLGTMIPFPSFFAVIFFSFKNQIKKLKSSDALKNDFLRFLSLTFFTIASFNDFSVISGLYDGYMIFSIGVMAGIILLSLDVNEKIIAAYRERDYLRQYLEKSVELKTEELKKKTNHLEETLSTLKNTQADLVQSAKMASLGTLSAGIAHEINNSLNYVNGALVPLEKLIKNESALDNRKKIDSLINIMKEGLRITFEIISSLRTYTGLNHAKLKDHKILELINSVKAILKSKINDKHIELKIEVDPELEIFVNAAGFNQVLMNLINNAIDALPERGKIQITAQKDDHLTRIKVQDNGCGIPSDILETIFDPFFTTKDVGNGTGLGLHISKSEIERHKGTLTANSNVETGTEFTITLPNRGEDVSLEDVA